MKKNSIVVLVVCFALISASSICAMQNNPKMMLESHIYATSDTTPYKTIDIMPRFPGCEDLDGTEREKASCAKEKLVKYIYSNIVYPEEALKKGIEGTAVVQFTIAEDGYIEDIDLLRGIGYGIDEAAIELVESMNDMDEMWTPGIQNGRIVKVLFSLPILYKLQ